MADEYARSTPQIVRVVALLTGICAASFAALLLGASAASAQGIDDGAMFVGIDSEQIEYSAQYDITFSRGAGFVAVLDPEREVLRDFHFPVDGAFTDMSLSPDGRYAFIAEEGSPGTGNQPSRVHRYDIVSGDWEVLPSPHFTTRLAAVGPDRILSVGLADGPRLLVFAPTDSGVMHVIPTSLALLGVQDIVFDANTSVAYAYLWSLSPGIASISVLSDGLANVAAFTEHPDQSLAGDLVLSSDGSGLYHGAVHYDAANLGTTVNVFPFSILAATSEVAFDAAGNFKSAATTAHLGSFDFPVSAVHVPSNGASVWATNALNNEVHYCTVSGATVTCQNSIVQGFTAPSPGALACTGLDFRWAGPSTGSWWMLIGSATDPVEHFSEDVGSDGFINIVDLPADGRDIHVRLWHLPVGGTENDWELIDLAVFPTCDLDSIAFVDPVTNSTICSVQQFNWTGPADGLWWLDVGTPENPVAYRDGVSASGVWVTDLPNSRDDGVSTLQFSLFYLPPEFDTDEWVLVRQETRSTCFAEAEIMVPTPGTAICSQALQVFVLEERYAPLYNDRLPGSWWMTVGTPDAPLTYFSAEIENHGGYPPVPIPSDGIDIVVKVWYLHPAGEYADWVVADSATYSNCTAAALSPVTGTPVCETLILDWTIPAAGNWWITVGTDVDLIGMHSESIGSLIGDSGQVIVPGVVLDGQPLRVKMWHQPLGGVYADWAVYEEATYPTCALPMLPLYDTLACGQFEIDYSLPIDGNWWITVGTGNDLVGLHSQPIAATTVGAQGTIVVGNLPSETTIFAKLWHQPFGGVYADWTVNFATDWATC